MIKIVETAMSSLYSIMDSNRWKFNNKDLCMVLEGIFEPYNIEFYTTNRPDIYFKFIKSAGTISDGTIDVGLSKNIKISTHLWRVRNNFLDFKINTFIKELVISLSHEMKHREQFEQGRYRTVDVSYKTIEEYYMCPSEIEAYAYEAAIEKLLGFEPTAIKIYKDYFTKDSEGFKTFMNKYNEEYTRLIN